MMGTKARLFQPVSAVSLDELVPANHFYRQLDRVVDLSFIRNLVHDTYADTGRPSIDPVVFFKLQLVMFFEDVRRDAITDAPGRRSAECALVCRVQSQRALA